MNKLQSWSGALCLAVVVSSVGMQVAEAQRAATGPPDWPCVQRLIPELSWGTIWVGPSPESLEQAWWEDEELGRVVRFATSREATLDQSLDRVRDFVERVANQPIAEREQRLTLLFAGLLERINHERSRVIERIRSATRGQVKRLQSLTERVDELEALRASGEASASEIERLQRALHWEQRTFQMRQQILPALCEKPYLLEEELSRMVRVIRAGMGKQEDESMGSME